MTQALLLLLAPGASIIHISSTRALQSEPHSEAYAAAKAGLLGLTHAQAASLAGKARVGIFFVCGVGWGGVQVVVGCGVRWGAGGVRAGIVLKGCG